MKGKVIESAEAILPLIILGGDGEGWEIDAVIDTGSNGELTLPADAIQQLGLEWSRDVYAKVGGDHLIPCGVFTTAVLWDGHRREIEIFQLESESLLGMKLLRDHRLTIEVLDGGNVEITPLTTDN